MKKKFQNFQNALQHSIFYNQFNAINEMRTAKDIEIEELRSQNLTLKNQITLMKSNPGTTAQLQKILTEGKEKIEYLEDENNILREKIKRLSIQNGDTSRIY